MCLVYILIILSPLKAAQVRQVWSNIIIVFTYYGTGADSPLKRGEKVSQWKPGNHGGDLSYVSCLYHQIKINKTDQSFWEDSFSFLNSSC